MLTVSRLSITPIRSFALHHPDQVEIGPEGVEDDRRFMLLDPDDRLLDGTRHGPMLRLRASLAHDPDRLTVTLPDGRVISDEVRLGDPRAVEVYGRRFAVRPVVGPLAGSIGEALGRPVELVRSERGATAGMPDRNAVSILSDASVTELARLTNDGRPLDARRFRMLVQVAGGDPYQEDGWMGSEVRIGEVVVRVTKPDPRCVITTLDPDTGERDFATLHAIKEARGMRRPRKLDFGVYAEVVTAGTVRVGDPVEPI